MGSSPAFAARRPGALVFTAALACSGPAAAQEPPSSWSLGVGLAGATSQRPYIGIDREFAAIPLIQFDSKYLKVFGPGLEVKLPGLELGETQKLNFGLVARYDFFSGYDAGDSWIFNGMRGRKGGLWAGAKVAWENSLANLTVEWSADVTGDSRGRMASLGIDRNWRLGKHLMLTPRLVATWQNDNYVDYYYGVRDSEARSWRPAYHGGAGVSAEVGLRGIYMFDKRHSVFLDVGVTSLPSQVRDSPLVGRSTENSLLVGYIYRFR